MNKNYYTLITGAGGSIGSELSIQLINSGRKNILLIDSSEEKIFYLKEKITNSGKSNKKINIVFFIGSITDKIMWNYILKKYQFSEVFHTAAYKHVNLLETNSYEAIYNNLIGTKILIEALENKCKKFIYVSTDKAVLPKNIMGYTKRAAELYLLSLEIKKININIVRFGNVLNSSGSVVPIFENQIRNKKSITVTSKNATRYFMSIKDAVNLLINSTKLNLNKKIFVLDMGKQIKILQLAKNMIKKSGYKPVYNKARKNEIKIEFIGLRKGEKLRERLTYSKLKKTSINKVLIANEEIKDKNIFLKLDKLINNFQITNINKSINNLKKLVNANK